MRKWRARGRDAHSRSGRAEPESPELDMGLCTGERSQELARQDGGTPRNFWFNW